MTLKFCYFISQGRGGGSSSLVEVSKGLANDIIVDNAGVLNGHALSLKGKARILLSEI